MNPVDGTDQENRITFQLYNYWFGLAENHGIPPLKALTPDAIASYKQNMVLIDLRDPDDEPTLQVVGQVLKQDIDPAEPLKYISDIPRRTMLSRITDHYMQVLANKLPISFDAEFMNKEKEKILYRTILLPFSDDDKTINFILGAIRWISEKDKITANKKNTALNPPPIEPIAEPESPQKDNFSLKESLEKCRLFIQDETITGTRSRKSLYKTLGAVFDFHKLCLAHIKDYEVLLQEAHIKKQERAPFTPTLKLCFGQDYDKTRLTEYALALSFAEINHQTGDSLSDFFDLIPGGIKGCVKAERKSRKRGHKNKTIESPYENYQEIIEKMPAITSFSLSDDSTQNLNLLSLMIMRRNGAKMDVVKILKEDNDVLKTILKNIDQTP
ncbi:MAG: hypothetical protein K9G26_02090 [Emcibacter sp.]|nr:hypothetical protein [Emcibacter sp.]